MFRLLQAIAAASMFAVSAAPASADALMVRYVNNADQEIRSLKIGEPGALADEANLLGDQPLEIGESIEIDVAPDRTVCVFDLSATFADGLTAVDAGVNLCDSGPYLALGGASALADEPACNWEERGTKLGRMYNDRFSGQNTAEAIEIFDMMGEALSAAVQGDVARACAIYDEVEARY